MSKFTKHRVTLLQGMLGDMAVDQVGWLSTQKQREFWENHEKHVAELKRTGQYLQPLEVEVTIEHDELFDAPVKKSASIESYRMTFLKFE